MMNIQNKWKKENREEEPLTVAADSLVHFAEGASPLFQSEADEDGVVAVEIARTAYLCMAQAAC